MRNKVVLIKGNINLSRDITLAEFERINADRVCLITALKRPQLLPHDFDTTNLNQMEMQAEYLLHHWHEEEHQHFVNSEYAEMVIDRGRHSVKAVEGDCLNIRWFYEIVKAFHKGFGSVIVECKIVRITPAGSDWNYRPVVSCGLTDQIGVDINGKVHKLDDAIELLAPHPELG